MQTFNTRITKLHLKQTIKDKGKVGRILHNEILQQILLQRLLHILTVLFCHLIKFFLHAF